MPKMSLLSFLRALGEAAHRSVFWGTWREEGREKKKSRYSGGKKFQVGVAGDEQKSTSSPSDARRQADFYSLSLDLPPTGNLNVNKVLKQVKLDCVDSASSARPLTVGPGLETL